MSDSGSKRKRLNFHWQIIALIASGILLLAVIGSLTAGFIINKKVSRLVYDQSLQITRNFAHRSILPLLSDASDSAVNDLQTTLGYSNVRALGIYTADGKLFIGSELAEYFDPSGLFAEGAAPFEPKLVKETPSLWTFVAPVYDRDVGDNADNSMDQLFIQSPTKLGYVSVTIDRTSLFKTEQELLRDNFLISLAVGLVVLIIAVPPTRRVVRPLYQFISLMRQAEKGDDSVRADFAGPVEVENMSRAFNTMMQALEQRREYAEQQHHSLQQENEERIRVEKALRKSEQNLKTLLSQHEAVVATVPGIIVEVDQKGNPIWWNRRAEQITGYSREEIANSNVTDFTPEDHREVVWSSILDCINDGKAELHTKVVTPNGMVPYQFSSVRIDHSSRDPGKATVLAIGMDESESVNAQLALAEARDAALESARAKSEFLANMSHEIRTPMNGMLGMLQLLAGSDLDSEQKNYAEIALRSADHLMNIINEVLDFSKIEAAKLELHKGVFSPRDLIEDVVELFATKAYEKDIDIYADIDFDIPQTVYTDLHRLKQIVSNLVNNAIKFTNEGYVLIRTYIVKSDGKPDNLMIDVIDTGIGIEEGAHEKVFESFAQADGSSTRKFSGTGLGLAIVKQLCELLGGHVDLESEYKKGSRFSITLPLKSLRPDFTAEQIDEKLPQGLAVTYIDGDLIQSAIFTKFCHFLDVPYSRITLEKGSAINLGAEKSQLYFVDLDSLDDPVIQDVLKALEESRLYVLVNHINSHDADEVLQRFKHLEKVLIPIRFTAFAELLINKRRQSEEHPVMERVVDTHVKGHKKRILVVDDNAINQRVIVTMLNNLGYEAYLASDGSHAIQLIEERSSIELVFMDCQMPVMDGYEAAGRIRASESGEKHVNIVAMTGNALEGDRDRCINAGMDDYLSKPIRLAQLKETLNKWLPG
jgi:PAS domain S-box-containing protein